MVHPPTNVIAYTESTLDTPAGHAALIRGNQDAWRSFRIIYAPLFASIARETTARMTGTTPSNADVDDVLAMTFKECWLSIGHHQRFDRTKGSLSSYVARISRNQTTEFVRKNCRYVIGTQPEDIDARVGIDEPTPEFDIDLKACLTETMEELEREGGSRHSALVQRAVHGLTTQEIAESEGVKPTTIRQRVRRSRVAIKRNIQRLAFLLLSGLLAFLVWRLFVAWVVTGLILPVEAEPQHPRDLTESDAAFMLQLCERDDGEACWELGRTEVLHGRRDGGVAHLERACRLEAASACRDLGILRLMEREWRGTEDGLELLELACEGGSGAACHDLGVFYHAGARNLGVSRNEQRGRSLLSRSAALGNSSVRAPERRRTLEWHAGQCERGFDRSCALVSWLGMEKLLASPDDDEVLQAVLMSLGRQCAQEGPYYCAYESALSLSGAFGKDTRAAVLGHLALNVGVVTIALRARRSARYGVEVSFQMGDHPTNALLRCGSGAQCNQAGLERWESDPRLARRLYAQACGRGFEPGCSNLALMHERGLGGPSDSDRAEALAQRACEEGHPTACRNLGRMLAPTRQHKGLEWYKMACRRHDAAACNAAGFILAKRAEPPDHEEARRHYELACTLNHPVGCTNLAYLHLQLESEDFDALGLYAIVCEEGHDKACLHLGDIERAAERFTRAAKHYAVACGRGHAAACNKQGLVVYAAKPPGWGTTVERLYEVACEQGELAGCSNRGWMYDKGIGVPRDEVRALQQYDTACTGGYARACLNLGRLLSELGRRDEARHALTTACAQGEESACR